MDVSEWGVVPACALAIVDLGPDVEFEDWGSDPLPKRLNFGGSIRIDSPTVRLLAADVPLVTVVWNVDATHGFNDEPFQWGMGSEFSLAQMLFLRAGVMDREDSYASDSDQTTGWGVGVGVPAGPIRARFDFTKTSIDDEDKLGVALDWIL
jgi:hypothetical protein